MESCSCSLNSSLSLKPQLLTSLVTTIKVNWRINKIRPHALQVSAHSYQKFIHFALNETKRHTLLVPSPLQEKFNSMTAMDGKTELKMQSFQSPKIRFLRSLSIENEAMQVLDFTVFARPEFDVPIFCANFFTAATMNIIVLDLNPLHNVIDRSDYKEKYYTSLLPVGLKYAEISCSFFLGEESSQAWLQLIEQAVEETDISQITCNREAQHKYLTWRAEKDPGHGVLKRLIGESLGKDVVRKFLFNGLDELGSKGFLDYFPDYRCKDGNINEKRSIIGKSFENRPWNAKGEFIGSDTNI